jgi:hypothetical protein
MFYPLMKIPTLVLVIASGLICAPSGYAADPGAVDKKEEAEAEEKIPADEKKFYLLGDAATKAFKDKKYAEAAKLALELEGLTPRFKDNWNYGNAIQDSNVILGRLAVRDGKLEKAKEHLLAAGRSPGSPQMDTFGPNMSLALDLLEKGEKKTVLEYFELCRKFWKMEDGKLDRWAKEVEAGKIPEFGGNLRY